MSEAIYVSSSDDDCCSKDQSSEVKIEPAEDANEDRNPVQPHCKHSEHLKSFCLECGIYASVNDAVSIGKDYDDLDKYISAAYKTRIQIKRDGHCLPRAVFRGAKELQCGNEFVNYRQLFRKVVDEIIDNIDQHLDFIVDSKESAIDALRTYLEDNKYALPSNSIDMVLVYLARMTECNLKIHYKDVSGTFDSHTIPCNKDIVKGTIELAFLHGHYDLVSKKRPVKNEGCEGTSETSLYHTAATDSLPTNHDSGSDDLEGNRLIQEDSSLYYDWEYSCEYVPPASSSCSSDEDSSDSTTEQVLNGADAWSRVEIEYVENVPYDIDGLRLFEIRALDRKTLLQKCKDGRKWKKDSETKWKGYEKVRYRDCSGFLLCPNVNCEYLSATGEVNKLKFAKKDLSCEICGAQGEHGKCHARKYIATYGLTAHVYHRGFHKCKAALKCDTSKIVADALLHAPAATPSSIKSGVVLSAMRARKPWDVIEREALKAANKKSISNEKIKQQRKSHPDGFGFSAVKQYKEYTDLKDKFFIFNVDEENRTIFKSSQTKMRIAMGMCEESNFLADEFCFFDGNQKRTKHFCTLSASMYHPLLRKQITLATMECPSESTEYVEAFWRKFNECFRQANEVQEKFLPKSGWVTDMADSNFSGLKLMYGEDVMRKIKGCEWHFQQSLTRHCNKFQVGSDREEFKRVSLKMMTATTTAAYSAEYEKLLCFVKDKNDEMTEWLDWWHSRRKVVFRAYTGSDKPRVNQAEVVHGGWSNSGEIGFSLLTAAEFDTKDALYLDCDVKLFETTRTSAGCGPSRADLQERRGEREVAAAKRMGSDILEYSSFKDSEVTEKKKAKRDKSVARATEIQVKKADEESSKMKVRNCELVSPVKRLYHVSNSNKGKTFYRVVITNFCSCSCPYARRNVQSYCKHVYFVLKYVLNGDCLLEASSLYLGDDDLKNAFDKAGSSIPAQYLHEFPVRKSCEDMKRLLAESPHFNDPQTWSMAPKDGRAGKCFHCKRNIDSGEMCLEVNGAIILPYGSVEPKKQKFVSCPKKSCYMLPPPWTNIRKPSRFSDDASRIFFSTDT